MTKSLARFAMAAVLVCGVSAIAAVGDTKHTKQDTAAKKDPKVRTMLRGELSGINIDTKTLNIKITKKSVVTDVEVVTDAKTEFLVDTVAATIADLKVGMRVTVRPDTGTATRVEAKSAPNSAKARKPRDDGATTRPAQ